MEVSAKVQRQTCPVIAPSGGAAGIVGFLVCCSCIHRTWRSTVRTLAEGNCTSDVDCKHGGHCAGIAPNRACACSAGWAGIHCEEAGLRTGDVRHPHRLGDDRLYSWHLHQRRGLPPRRSMQWASSNAEVPVLAGLEWCHVRLFGSVLPVFALCGPSLSPIAQREIAPMTLIASTEGLARALRQAKRASARPAGVANFVERMVRSSFS